MVREMHDCSVMAGMCAVSLLVQSHGLALHLLLNANI